MLSGSEDTGTCDDVMFRVLSGTNAALMAAPGCSSMFQSRGESRMEHQRELPDVPAEEPALLGAEGASLGLLLFKEHLVFHKIAK